MAPAEDRGAAGGESTAKERERRERRAILDQMTAEEMSSPDPACEQHPELPVEELFRRAMVHPPYGEQVIDDLTPEEADAFLDAVLS